MKSLQQKKQFLVTCDTHGCQEFETSLKANKNSNGLPLSAFIQASNNENEVQTQDFNLKKYCQVSLHPSTIKKVKLSENESHRKINKLSKNLTVKELPKNLRT